MSRIARVALCGCLMFALSAQAGSRLAETLEQADAAFAQGDWPSYRDAYAQLARIFHQKNE
ncbi:hypothetical protein [Pseudomarimonas arenosa]|uniref:Uncharacterized protein n=1 Tax=Pseudomarimonas arenosa TaxID=2774145 RepID=A0AAW3ZWA9_9GAMM|nr:hypothetical protein [Pseudomarimonas arenosa]MBD8528336.1 hypothetical protein [Pseudomarimonas arenosa]